MNNDINFLEQRQKQLEAAVDDDKKYLYWMLYLFIGVMVVAAGLFGFDFYLSRSIATVQSQQADVTTQLANHQAVEAKYLELVSKVGFIDTILTDRTAKRESLQFFTSLFLSDDVSISEIGFQTPQVLEFSLISSNIFVLEQALDKLESPEVQQRFASLSTTDLNRKEDGEYTLHVTAGLNSNTESVN